MQFIPTYKGNHTLVFGFLGMFQDFKYVSSILFFFSVFTLAILVNNPTSLEKYLPPPHKLYNMDLQHIFKHIYKPNYSTDLMPSKTCVITGCLISDVI